MEQIHYEPAIPAEADFLTQFAMDSNAVYDYRNVSEDIVRQVFLVKPEDFKSGMIIKMIRRSELLGFYSLRARQNQRGQIVNELGHLFLRDCFQRKGYGRLLFQKAMSDAKKMGWKEIEWISDPFAAEFYLKMGAKHIDDIPCLINTAYVTPIFCYDLTSS